MKCPSCNKFAALDMQEPEVNDLSLDVEGGTVTAEVRILRNSSCCGDEMKEYTFNAEVDIRDTEVGKKMNAIAEKAKEDGGEEAEFEVEDGGCTELEEGGGRYAKSYFGFELVAIIKHGDEEVGRVDISDKVAASEMDELN